MPLSKPSLPTTIGSLCSPMDDKRYIWLVELIYNAGRISREEINSRWARAESGVNDDHSSYQILHISHAAGNSPESTFASCRAYARKINEHIII